MYAFGRRIAGACRVLTDVHIFPLVRQTPRAATSMTDRDYYARRAEEEVRRAAEAVHPAVAAAHYKLSSAYFERLNAERAEEQKSA